MTTILTVTEVKSFLQIAHTNDDTLLTTAIADWEAWLADELSIYMYNTSGDVVDYCDGGKRSLWPSYLPINSITKIEDHEEDDDEYDDTAYQFSNRRIELEDEDSVWESGVKRWKVTYNAGYAKSSPPPGMKMILLDLIYRWYWGRGAGDPKSLGYSYNWEAESLTKGTIGYRMRKLSMRMMVS